MKFEARNSKFQTNLFRISIFGFLIFFTACGKPAEDADARVQRLGRQLRCPVCRGVPISESPATLALEMMDLLRVEGAQGKTDEEILKFFEERYGEWVLLDPKPEGMNLAVWVLPLLVLVGGAGFIVRKVKREREV